MFFGGGAPGGGAGGFGGGGGFGGFGGFPFGGRVDLSYREWGRRKRRNQVHLSLRMMSYYT